MITPLAERMRPKSLLGYIGQQHLVGENGVIRRMVESRRLVSFILWGPPGVGKTSLARVIASALDLPFYTLSAVSSGVKEVRDVIARAQKDLFYEHCSPVLFIDEIHRFSKSQQDSLLDAVERGIVTLIGATTENPSFEIIRPLLSRCQVYTLNPLEDADLLSLLRHVLTDDFYLSRLDVTVQETDALLRYAGGDARKFLNIIDLVCDEAVAALESDDLYAANGESGGSDGGDVEAIPPIPPVIINDEIVISCLQANPMAYDKGGEIHYDLASAMIKSIRGSDPDAAVYYLARMVAGGEDPVFIARRLVISASEDIGLANPNALLMANATFDAVQKIGWPEARIPLAQAAIYLAASPKSNSAYEAIDKALQLIKQTGNLPVPLHLRNAPTEMMASMGYGQDYKYAHNYAGHFVRQQYLPDQICDQQLWSPQSNTAEAKLAARMRELWGDRYK